MVFIIHTSSSPPSLRAAATEFEGPGPMRLEPMGLPGRCTFFRLTPTTGARVWVVQCVAAGGKVVVVRVAMRWNVASRMRCVRIHPKCLPPSWSILAARRLHAGLQMVSFAAPQKQKRQGRCRGGAESWARERSRSRHRHRRKQMGGMLGCRRPHLLDPPNHR